MWKFLSQRCNVQMIKNYALQELQNKTFSSFDNVKTSFNNETQIG